MEMKEKIAIVDSWLKDISKSLGVQLSLNQEGACSFQVGEETIIGIEVSSSLPIVHLFSPLLQLPEDKDKALLVALRALELNAFQALTRGGAVAITPGGGPLLFCYSVPIEGTDSHLFSQVLGDFYETAPEIRRLINEASDVTTI